VKSLRPSERTSLHRSLFSLSVEGSQGQWTVAELHRTPAETRPPFETQLSSPLGERNDFV